MRAKLPEEEKMLRLERGEQMKVARLAIGLTRILVADMTCLKEHAIRDMEFGRAEITKPIESLLRTKAGICLKPLFKIEDVAESHQIYSGMIFANSEEVQFYIGKHTGRVEISFKGNSIEHMMQFMGLIYQKAKEITV